MGLDERDETASYAAIEMHRRVEWADTDAAGIAHWLACLRLVEIAEAALHTALGVADQTIGAVPRLAADVTYHGPLRFNDLTVVHLRVNEIGTTSLRYAFAIDGPQGSAATGGLAVCLVDHGTGRPRPWPADVRAALRGGGMQSAGPGRR